MAAPLKEGLIFWSCNCDILEDRKFRKGRKEYGIQFIYAYIALLCLIYSDKGYYIVYNDKTKDDVLWELRRLFEGKYQPTEETVGEMIELLVESDLFSGDHFKNGIITSHHIQENYYRTTVDRKIGDKINFDIWMLTEEEMRKISRRSLILSSFVNRSNNSINRPDNSINQSNYEQSKEEKSKVNKSTVNKSKINESSFENIKYIISYFKTQTGNKPGIYAKDSLKRYIDAGMSVEAICSIIDENAGNDRKTWGDVERKLLEEYSNLIT